MSGPRIALLAVLFAASGQLEPIFYLLAIVELTVICSSAVGVSTFTLSMFVRAVSVPGSLMLTVFRVRKVCARLRYISLCRLLAFRGFHGYAYGLALLIID